jgi:putative membrane protein
MFIGAETCGMSLSGPIFASYPAGLLGMASEEKAMIIAGLVFAALAALLHVYIFTMESLTWTSPRTRATFGTTAEEAETTKLLAFNQGFYNLFLAVVSGVGIAAVVMGHNAVGAALVFAGVGSMAAAAIVLLLSSPDKARAAVTQGTFPLIAIVLLALGLVA